jgi:type IV pilus assembly protein PilA
MLARIRKSVEDKDQGFTLIELLVVMIIIGILAAIAIPVFLNQRKKAVDTGVRSDLKTIATAEETFYTDGQVYGALTGSSATSSTVKVDTTDVKVSTGNTFVVKFLKDANTSQAAAAGAAGFCITGLNTSGDKSAALPGLTYNSLNGGISTTACP